jgi:predicted transcriptional regulator
MSKTLVEMAADLVQSQCSTKSMTTEEMTFALQSAFKSLQALQVNETRSTQGVVSEGLPGMDEFAGIGPDIKPEKSIQKNKIICMECGQEFRMLSPKHLRSHGLTGREYRKKYGFSLRQPLCAKSLSDRRKKAGKERGLPDNLRKAIAKRKKKGSAKK